MACEQSTSGFRQPAMAPYDPRYVEGIRLFNEHEFFACHDVLEDLWGETLGKKREFYQGLIHVSVALHHFEEGNLGGARKMFESARRYLTQYAPSHEGVDVKRLLEQLADCFAELLGTDGRYPTGAKLQPARVPVITLDPNGANTEVSR